MSDIKFSANGDPSLLSPRTPDEIVAMVANGQLQAVKFTHDEGCGVSCEITYQPPLEEFMVDRLAAVFDDLFGNKKAPEVSPGG